MSDDPGVGKITLLSYLLNYDVHKYCGYPGHMLNNIVDVGLFVSSASG